MIVYLDASALVERYVAEAGSADVGDLIERAAVVGTAILSRAEVAAALAKAARMKLVPRANAAAALQAFTAEWESLVRLQMTEILVARAADLAWEHGLRGYAVAHLAAALFWQDVMGDPVTVATYDWQHLGCGSGRGPRRMTHTPWAVNGRCAEPHRHHRKGYTQLPMRLRGRARRSFVRHATRRPPNR